MPRRDFLADFAVAKAAALPNGIISFATGEDDGTFVFEYSVPDAQPIIFQAMIPEVSEYPKHHTWFVYSISDHVPVAINNTVESLDLIGLRIHPMLCKISSSLNNAATGEEGEQMDIDEEYEEGSDIDTQMDDPFDDGNLYDDIQPEYTDKGVVMRNPGPPKQQPTRSALTAEEKKELQRMIKKDLQFAKKAGFRVSSCGDIFAGNVDCYVTISCRVAKLGLEDNTLQAWHMKARKYFMLVIRYPQGYQTQEDATGRGPGVQLKAILTDSHKISFIQAVHLLNTTKEPIDSTDVKATKIDSLFIDRPLNELLNGRLLALIRYRQQLGLSWSGAEEYYNDCQGNYLVNNSVVEDRYYKDDGKAPPHLPSLTVADHLSEALDHHSFPLVAMQLALRHLTRCTEFCLVCHSRLENSFEALKPYVCSKPLCLYQYMSLGFGPSIESEILSQPDVVDLLISFCYTAAFSRVLSKKLPVGMGLTVPPILPPKSLSKLPVGSKRMQDQDLQHLRFLHGLFDEQKSEITTVQAFEHRILPGQWIYVAPSVLSEGQHHYVKAVWGNTLQLGPPVRIPRSLASGQRPTSYSATNNMNATSTSGASNIKMVEVQFAPWSAQFDELDEMSQQAAILDLLDITPSLPQMKAHIVQAGQKGGSLLDWKERFPPAVIGILRWIIASNRSCIVQVDSIDENDASEAGLSGLPSNYVQFRFAQGAPDKEQRFVDAVNKAKERLDLQFPTIFAWHGSPLENWHCIIREGLNFDVIRHGRANGNGVYHSLSIGTSQGYSNYRSQGPPEQHFNESWPGSRLNFSSAICLNEIVNAPDEFTSRSPHLVVQHVDWIQTRYLFVASKLQPQSIKKKYPKETLAQHPLLRPTANGTIELPISAIPRSRHANTMRQDNSAMSIKRILYSRKDIHPSDESGFESEDSSADEIALYNNDTFLDGTLVRTSNPLTDFEPGKLIPSTLPMLEPPSYATTRATKALQRELRAALATQKKTPLHELGWYLDPNLVTNMYQWIFELHSFDPALPLARDLKAKKITSVILEVRYGAEFPYSPPFIRVVRPRFLPFLQGGGGHVTNGGAMCMELLTNNGWNPASAIESVILQVRMALTSCEPRPARLEDGKTRDYGIGEAVSAFRRACEQHGWTVPSDFGTVTNQVSKSADSL